MKHSVVASILLCSANVALAAPAIQLEDGLGSRPGAGHPIAHSSANDDVVGAADVAPSPHVPGGEEYVVIFDADKEVAPEMEEFLSRLNLTSSDTDVRYTFENSAFRGFAANMQSHCLDLLDQDVDVAMVEKTVTLTSLDTRGGSPWGLQRISESQAVAGDEKATVFNYNFDGADSTQGAGVDIYVVDTGVNVDHVVFGGRAKNGFSFEKDVTDGDGHGTHVAGTAAGSYFGVASGANVWAVKVLGADGSGSSSDTIAGMNWVINHHDNRKKEPGFVGAIMSMSWGLDGQSPAVSQAIKLATDNGIHVSVAAGNAAKDSCSAAPSSSGGSNGPAVTVGSIGIDDAISSFSNTGACNDVYGPGENILSAWPTAPNMVNYLSGTSMACPHVTGVMAYLMVEKPEFAQDPAALKAFLQQNGLPNVASGNANSGDPKVLVNNGQTGGNARAVKRTIRLRDEDAGPISRAVDWASSILRKVRRSGTEEMEFVVKRAPVSGTQLRY